MLTIRMARVGKRNKAQFKIMLQESTEAPGGRHVEILGSYDPHQKMAVLKDERIKYWLTQGAQISDTVHNLLVSKGLVTDKKRAVKLPARIATQSVADGPKKAEEPKAEEAKAEEVKEEIKAEEKVEEKIEDSKKEEKAEEVKKEEKPEEPKSEEVKSE